MEMDSHLFRNSISQKLKIIAHSSAPHRFFFCIVLLETFFGEIDDTISRNSNYYCTISKQFLSIMLSFNMKNLKLGENSLTLLPNPKTVHLNRNTF